MGLKSGFGPFWEELRRRKVVRAGGFYAVGAFVALQLGEIVLPAFNTPDWALQSLVVAAALGLPVVLAVAWAYELTSEGLRRTENSPAGLTGPGPGAARSLAPRLALLAVTTVSVAFAAVWFSRSFMSASDGDGSGWRSAFSSARDSRLGAGPHPPAGPRPHEVAGPGSAPVFANFDPEAPVAAIAVLPLANFAEDGDDLFARQLHDEIINQLTARTSLRVVSRTSVARYADTTMQLPRIARELGVQAVVTGSVAMTAEDDSARISIQLLHAPSDTHLMTRTYQREMKDILRLQTEIALEIAQAVQAEVEGEPAPGVEHVASVDPEAHQAYLRGWEELDQELGSDAADLAAVDLVATDLEAVGLEAAELVAGDPDALVLDAGDLEAANPGAGAMAGEAANARTEALNRAALQAMRHFSEAVGIDSTFGMAWLGQAEAGLVLLAKTGDMASGATAGEASEGAEVASLREPATPREFVARIQESVRRAEALGVPKLELDIFRVALLNVAKDLDDHLAEDVEATLAEAGVATDSLVRAYVRNSTDIGRHVERFVAARGVRPTRELAERRALARQHRAARRFLEAGQYQLATAAYQEMVSANPSDELSWRVLEDVYGHVGDYAGAVRVWEQRLLATRPDTPERTDQIAALDEAFDEDDPGSYWRLRLQEAHALQTRGESVPHTVQAYTAVGLGDVDQAFEHLEEAVALREPFLGMSLASPIWDPIRGDARFRGVAERLWRRGG